MKALVPCALASGLVLLACGKNTEPAPPAATGKKSEAAKAGANAADGGGPSKGGDPLKLPDDASLLKAKYQIVIEGAGVKACKGNVIVRIAANFEPKPDGSNAQLLQIPDGLVKCPAFGTFDLKEMLGSLGGAGEASEASKNPLEIKDNLISIKGMGQSTYEPARPFMPSFLAASPEELKKFDVKREVSLTDAKEKTNAKGTVQVRTVSFGEGFQPPGVKRNFENVLYFEMLNDGFEGANKVTNFLFDRLAMRISLEPFAILSISFKGRASDLAEGAEGLGPGAGGIGDILGGNKGPSADGSDFGAVAKSFAKLISISAELTLLDMQGIDESSQPAESVADGPSIGGSKVD